MSYFDLRSYLFGTPCTPAPQASSGPAPMRPVPAGPSHRGLRPSGPDGAGARGRVLGQDAFTPTASATATATPTPGSIPAPSPATAKPAAQTPSSPATSAKPAAETPSAPAKPDSPESAGTRPGTLQLFTEPTDGVQPVLDAIDGAKTSIDVELYMLSDHDVINALLAAAQRGVQVQVLLEQHPMGGNPNGPAFQALQAAGATVAWTNPRYTFTHEKAILVDDREALVMTANSTYSSYNKNREYGLVDTDARDVKALTDVFTADQTGADPAVDDPNLVLAPIDARAKLLALVNSAQHSLVVEQEELNDPQLAQAIADRSKAGVDVTVELAAPRDAKDTRTTSQVDHLEADGLDRSHVKYLKAPYLHAKLILADGERGYLGSVNLSANSMDHNREAGLLFTDPTILDQLTQQAAADWNAGVGS